MLNPVARTVRENEPGAKGTRAVWAGRRRRQTPRTTFSLLEKLGFSPPPLGTNSRPPGLVPIRFSASVDPAGR